MQESLLCIESCILTVAVTST